MATVHGNHITVRRRQTLRVSIGNSANIHNQDIHEQTQNYKTHEGLEWNTYFKCSSKQTIYHIYNQSHRVIHGIYLH